MSSIKTKGEHASATENRRLVWDCIIWPLLLQINRPYFTIEEYRMHRNKFSIIYNISIPVLTRGLISLVNKGILMKNNNRVYSVDYRLIPYMQKRRNLAYSLAVKKAKR